MEIVGAIENGNHLSLSHKFQAAVGVINRALALYSPHELSFSFNGGKDSTVLLHLLRAAVATQKGELKYGANGGTESAIGGMGSFVFEEANDFPQIREFTQAQIRKYNLHCKVFPVGTSFQAGLQELVETCKVKACVIGTRAGDPNSEGQSTFCPSSDGWPAFMRINPILNWSYDDVWAFLKATNVEYCQLYDRGYTSVGGVHDTFPNANLKLANGEYLPAYMLTDGTQERVGRTNTKLQSRKADVSPSEGVALEVTVGILVVGGEILAGKVHDENSPYLCKQLRQLGCSVRRICIVPDNVRAIAEQVQFMSDTYDVVVTTGGTGPTLDDVTMAGIAEALGKRLTTHPVLERRLRGFYGTQLTDAHLKMAQVPEDVIDIIDGDEEVPASLAPGKEELGNPFPLLRCHRNIYVLPGVPELLVHQFGLMKSALIQGIALKVKPFVSRELLVKKNSFGEGELSAALEKAHLIVKREGNSPVYLGSYPIPDTGDGVGIKLTVEGKDSSLVNLSVKTLRDNLPPRTVVTIRESD